MMGIAKQMNKVEAMEYYLQEVFIIQVRTVKANRYLPV